MTCKLDKNDLKAGVITLVLAFTTPFALVQARESSDDPEMENSNFGILEEITITANKRGALSAQDLASSITAFNSEKIDRLNAVDFEEFITQVPGTNFLDNGGPGRGHEVASVRGLSPVGDNTEGVVATYLDGAPRSGSNYRLFDIGEISVLRGPQGTLWGAQSIGGLISYKSKRPDPEQFDAHVGTDVYSSSGDDGPSYRIDGHVNVPVIEDKLTLRFAGHTIDESGYVDNVVAGDDDVNDVDEKAWRISALFALTDDLTLTAIYHGNDIHTDAPTYFSLDLGGRKIDKAKSDLPSNQEYDLFNFVADWDLGRAQFNYTGSYFDLENIFLDFDDSVFSTAGWLGDVISITDEQSWTHEIRFSSSGDNQLNWIVGFYYDNVEVVNLERIVNISDPLDPTAAPPFGEDFEFSVIGGPEDRREYALFAELSHDVNEKWQVLLGARWFDWEVDNHQQFTFFGTNFQQATGKVGDDDTFYKVQVNFTPTEDLLFYVTRSEGFRFGGFNPFVGAALNIPESFIKFEPDTLINYEVGAKLTLHDRQMLVNTSLYFMEWEEIQTVVRNEDSTWAFTANGPDLEASGLEVEIVTQDLLFPGFYAAISYTYTDNEFQNDAVIFPNTPSPPLIEKGDELRRTAKNAWSVDIGYDFAISDDLNGFVRANYWHRDKTSTKSFNSNDGDIDIAAQEVINVSTGVETEQWEVKLYVDNIEDKRPLINVFPADGDNTRAATASSIRPRTVGLKVVYKFAEL